jgi:hypothetical protein
MYLLKKSRKMNYRTTLEARAVLYGSYVSQSHPGSNGRFDKICFMDFQVHAGIAAMTTYRCLSRLIIQNTNPASSPDSLGCISGEVSHALVSGPNAGWIWTRISLSWDRLL